MNTPPIVYREQWEAAREEMLVKEKELTRARDALAAERRGMPWMAVEKEYDGPDGKASLLDLFEGRRAADRLPLLLRARGDGLAGARVRRLLVPRRPGCSSRPLERPRHHSRLCLTRAPSGRRALEGADGVGDPVVHDHRRFRLGLWRTGTARTPSSAIATGSSARTSSTTAATRRWAAPGAVPAPLRAGSPVEGRSERQASDVLLREALAEALSAGSLHGVLAAREGRIEARVSERMSLEEAASALGLLASGRASGKIVLVRGHESHRPLADGASLAPVGHTPQGWEERVLFPIQVGEQMRGELVEGAGERLAGVRVAIQGLGLTLDPVQQRGHRLVLALESLDRGGQGGVSPFQGRKEGIVLVDVWPSTKRQ